MEERWSEVQDKVAEYLAAGVRLVWVVDPQRRQVHRYREDGTAEVLQESDTLDGEGVVPGFRLPVADLLRRRHRAGGKSRLMGQKGCHIVCAMSYTAYWGDSRAVSWL
jgi:hypothetical protein